MEVKTKRFIIKYREGIVSVAANDVAEAIERFKELRIETNRYIIKYKEGFVNVPANNVEEAIERFKELRIETSAKELTIVPADEMYKRREEIFGK